MKPRNNNIFQQLRKSLLAFPPEKLKEMLFAWSDGVCNNSSDEWSSDLLQEILGYKIMCYDSEGVLTGIAETHNDALVGEAEYIEVEEPTADDLYLTISSLPPHPIATIFSIVGSSIWECGEVGSHFMFLPTWIEESLPIIKQKLAEEFIERCAAQSILP